MKRRVIATALLISALAAAVTARNGAAAKALVAANDAWERGDYITALNSYLKLMESPAADAAFDAIALQTGELFGSRELTTDGRNPRFSADATLVAFESGLEVSRHTQVVRNDARLTKVADLPGVSATFSPTANVVAYLKIGSSPTIAAAAKTLDEANLAAANRGALIQALAFEVLRSSTITVRDLASGAEKEIATPGLLKTGLAYGADGRTLYFLGGREGEDQRNDIYGVTEGQEPSRLSEAAGFKSVPTVDPSGAVVLFTTTAQNPFRRPGGPGQGGGGGRGGGAGAQAAAPTIGIIDLASRKTTMVEGTSPGLSSDGKALVFVARSGADYVVMTGPTNGPFTPTKKGPDRLDAPALSPDGKRIAYQMMTRDDWEIYSANRDGSGEVRVTRDLQHDLLPRFISNDVLFSMGGEARHRRSALYNLTNGARTRVFHNNTVRTIAPEYQWVLSFDGSQVLIGSERDGDTVSPERGVYIVDLKKKITKPALLDRLRSNLAAETTLRANGTKAYAPIAADVKRVVDAASVARVYNYEKALFDFDSKHISRPGNKLASEYLFNTYASFGYTPEYQWFDNANALGGRTANVIATLRGTVNPELVYVVSSHYDSVAGGPGADDDSSGTAALLEAARVLAQTPMPATIIFASFTGEEAGLLGSREFVRRAVQNKMQIVGALNNDMIGFANDGRLDNTIRYSNPGIRDIQHAGAMLFTRLITYDALYFKSTDAAAYYDAYGDIVGGIGSYPVLSNPHYHQSHDFLEFENHELITETSKATTATLMLLASSPSRIKDLKVEANGSGAATVNWTAGPEKGITSYVVAYGPPNVPQSKRVTVKTARAKLTGITPGTVVAVKAVNARGLEGWDWARAIVK